MCIHKWTKWERIIAGDRFAQIRMCEKCKKREAVDLCAYPVRDLECI